MNEARTRNRRDARLEKLYAAAVFYRATTFLLLIVVAVETGVIIWQANSARFARAIRVNDKVVCFVRNEKAAEEVRNRIIAEEKGNLPGAAFLDQRWEDLNWPMDKDDKILTVAEAVKRLRPKLTVKVAAAAITLKDKELVVLADKELADMALTMLKKEFSEGPGKLIEARLLPEGVKIADTKAQPKAILTDIHAAVEKLKTPSEGIEKYVVRSGDSWRRISDIHKMTIKELRAMNPKVKDPLQVGVSLTVSVPSPPLTVVTIKEENHEEEYRKPPQKIETNTLPKGETRNIPNTGSPGIRRITEKITYHNGKELKRAKVDETIIKEAVPERIMVGTAVADDAPPSG